MVGAACGGVDKRMRNTRHRVELVLLAASLALLATACAKSHPIAKVLDPYAHPPVGERVLANEVLCDAPKACQRWIVVYHPGVARDAVVDETEQVLADRLGWRYYSDDSESHEG